MEPRLAGWCVPKEVAKGTQISDLPLGGAERPGGCYRPQSEYLRNYGTESGSGLSFRRPGPGAGQPRLPAAGSALPGGSDSTGRREIPHVHEAPGSRNRASCRTGVDWFSSALPLHASSDLCRPMPSSSRSPAPPSLVFVFIRFGAGCGEIERSGGNATV